MNLSIHGQFNLHQLGTATPIATRLGVASLFSRLVAAGAAGPLSVVSAHGGVAPRPLDERQHPGDAEWSLWTYANGCWAFRVIGASSLDDLADDIVLELMDGDDPVDELRICPPGAPHPARVS